jgi:indole-3-glycerol phosphate synthase
MDAGWLDDLLARKKEEVSQAKRELPLVRLKQRITGWPPPRNFVSALLQGSGIIAEFKRASPSGGLLREGADGAALGREYEANGASALSVVTDRVCFQGSLDDLERVRKGTALPVLRKDFLLDSYQLYESRLWGADAVLLIARLFSPAKLKALIAEARALGLTVLVEVHDSREVLKALKVGADPIGVNNRDLVSLEVNPETALTVGASIPEGILKIVESGIRSRKQIARYRQAGFSGFLVGEHLMRSKSPGEALRQLWSA